MNEQRRQILQMLAEGKITADEAERLIDALEREQPESPPGAAPRPKPRPKYLRVVVNSEDDSGGDGPSRVNVRVPLQLLRAGVRLTSLIPPQALTQVNAELHKSGVPIDLTQLKPQHIEELIEQLDELTVDIDGPDGEVRVFCE
jgi:SHOCT-like domain